ARASFVSGERGRDPGRPRRGRDPDAPEGNGAKRPSLWNRDVHPEASTRKRPPGSAHPEAPTRARPQIPASRFMMGFAGKAIHQGTPHAKRLRRPAKEHPMVPGREAAPLPARRAAPPAPRAGNTPESAGRKKDLDPLARLMDKPRPPRRPAGRSGGSARSHSGFSSRGAPDPDPGCSLTAESSESMEGREGATPERESHRAARHQNLRKEGTGPTQQEGLFRRRRAPPGRNFPAMSSSQQGA